MMYQEMLTGERIRPSSRGSKDITEEVESDRARVLYSASFRRLQRKTQVFPLEDNASVRTRLTHSLEVAHVGRYLATSVIGLMRERGIASKLGLDDTRFQHAFSVTVEVACLLHDIGNPPFGHFGEVAISKWFLKNGPPDECFADLQNFDGNPQGFRIVTRLNGVDGSAGMNLSFSQLAATMKYQSVHREQSRFKKFGVFYSEEDTMKAVRQRFSLAPEQRFPLAYLMEAADDISYCLSDIEDGIEKKIVSHRKIVQDLLDLATDASVREIIEEAQAATATVPEVDEAIVFRSRLIRILVENAAENYVSQHDSVLAGIPLELIPATTPHGQLLKLIKKVVRRDVYTDSSIQSLELGGLAIITGLLEKFGELLEVPRDEFKALTKTGERVKGRDAEKRLVDFIASKHLSTYLALEKDCDDILERWHRSHLLVDYISGMTDPFALKMHQILGGTRL